MRTEKMDRILLDLLYEYRKVTNETLCFQIVKICQDIDEVTSAQYNVMRLGSASSGILTELNIRVAKLLYKLTIYQLIIKERKNILN